MDLIDQLRADWKESSPDLDTSGIDLEGRLIRLGRLLEQKTEEVLKSHGLRYTDFDILATLRRQGAPYSLTPTQLLQSILLTSGAMTAALKRLETAGWIERGSDEMDGRVRTVILLPAGRTLANRVVKARFQSALETSSLVRAAERKSLIRSLRELLLAVEGA